MLFTVCGPKLILLLITAGGFFKEPCTTLFHQGRSNLDLLLGWTCFNLDKDPII